MVVYIIRNRNNGKVYVGSTSNFEVRKYSHLQSLKGGSHFNNGLQNDFDLGHKFDWEILVADINNRKDALIKEREEILKHPNCYNVHGLEEKIPITIYLNPSEAINIGRGGDIDREILETIKRKLDVYISVAGNNG